MGTCISNNASPVCCVFLTCRAVVSLRELDLDFVLPGDVLYAAAFRPHDGAVVALGDGHLHAHLRLLLERGRQPGNSSTDGKHTPCSRFIEGLKSEGLIPHKLPLNGFLRGPR